MLIEKFDRRQSVSVTNRSTGCSSKTPWIVSMFFELGKKFGLSPRVPISLSDNPSFSLYLRIPPTVSSGLFGIHHRPVDSNASIKMTKEKAAHCELHHNITILRKPWGKLGRKTASQRLGVATFFRESPEIWALVAAQSNYRCSIGTTLSPNGPR